MDVADDSDEMLLDASDFPDSSQDSLIDVAQHLWSSSFTSLSSQPTEPDSANTTNFVVERARKVSVTQPSARRCKKGSTDPTPTAALTSLAPAKTKDDVITLIETIFEAMIDVLLNKGDMLTIPLASRASAPALSMDENGEHDVLTSAVRQVKEITFPGKTAQEAWRFTVMIRILELIHDALTAEVVMTKRDIYYRDPALFGKQAVVDRYVDDLAFTFGATRSMLNVSAAAKGLVVGKFTIVREDGSLLDGLAEPEGCLVWKLDESDLIMMRDVKFVLVVEKEASFRSLSSGLSDMLASNSIMVTAKGYPDILTRQFLRALTTPSSQNGFCSPAVYALVDCDPDGLDILSNYRHGSKALAHENAALVLPGIRWLGVKSTQALAVACADDVHANQGLLKLTMRDRRKAVKMLERPMLAEDGPEQEWRKELQVMLLLSMKAEIQMMEAREGGLAGWVKEQLADDATLQ